MCDFGNIVCEGVASVAKSAFAEIADSAASAAGQLIVDAFTWWLHTPGVDVQQPAVVRAQSYTLPLIAVVLMGSVLVQALRMTLSRKPNPALNVGVGLVRYFVVSTLGLVVLAGAVKAADDFAVWVVNQGMADFAVGIRRSLTADVITNPFLLLILGLLGVLLGALQWVLGFVRQAGILVLAALLPLAAAGSINDSTKVWLNRMFPWLVTLVFYRPMAALIYMIGFEFLGTGADVTTAMTGLMVLVLAVIAMPAMLRFFSWAGVSMSSGGGAVMAGAIGAASLASAASRTSAVQHANHLETHGPGSDQPPPSGADPSGGPRPGPVGPGGTGGGRGTPGSPEGGSAAGAADSSPKAAGGAAVAAGAGGAAAVVSLEAFRRAQQAAGGTVEGMTGGGGEQQ
jgi:hypothetical protein